MKTTNTPWTVDVTETGVYLCAGVEDVAEFRHSGRHGAAISQEEAVANATLAAAAPKMLETLRRIANGNDAYMAIAHVAIIEATRKLP